MILEKRKQCQGEGGGDLRLFVCSSKNTSGSQKESSLLDGDGHI